MFFSYSRYISLFLIVLLFTNIKTGYASTTRVKIATIGVPTPVIKPEIGTQNAVKQMTTFWDNQVKQVLSDSPDVILLPENSDVPRGFNMDAVKKFIAEGGHEQIQHYLSSMAQKNNCYIAYGSIRYDRGGKLRSSSVLLDRKGRISGIYNKNYPTIGEIQLGIVPDDTIPLFQCDFGKVAMVICFDLNFEELRNKLAKQKPDIILFPSAYHGGMMQSNWAYACHSFFVGSISGQGTFSEIRNPLGEIVASSTNYFSYAVATINLNSKLVHLGYNFEKLEALKEKYGAIITIEDPGELGPVLVSSEDEKLKICDLLHEFDIETLEDYMNRSREFRLKLINKD